ncbi:MAG: universal stress protein [Dehalococcoidia bacterium]|jgi:nucleotide-binding universal stress UspA family protein|nr:universal stress protein [Dehalococcoidia bacterium]
MFRRILTPLDGSKSSENVLQWVAPLAEALSAELILTTVVEVNPVASAVWGAERSRSNSGPIPEPAEVLAERESRRSAADDLINSATSYLESVSVHFVPDSVDTKFHVATGTPEEQIIATAISTEADLIAMATHRASWIARGVLGSVADRVVRSSPVSVLLLRPVDSDAGITGPTPIKNVIVPLDGSPISEAAVDVGRNLSRAVSAKLHFLTAASEMYGYGPSVGGPYGQAYTDSGLREEVRKYLMPYVDEAAGEAIDARAVAVSGSAARAIIRVAHEEQDSIVVMASHGLSGFHRWMLGSVTDKVIRSAECPVIVVPGENPVSN